jgi:DNA-binding response OmpR family regulator
MKNILIASSSSIFIERNGSLLRRSDFRIFTAESGSEAMAIISAENIDLILLDIQLSDQSGESFCLEVCNKGFDPKSVIILVCHDSEADFQRLKGSGADVLISRPIMPLQLIKTVGQFLTVQLVRSRRVSLRVKVISRKDDIEFYCMSQNISLTGMLIETEFSLELGCIILCQFSIPGTADVETEGEIVRSSRAMDGSHQYGIHFTSLNRRFRHEIDNYIAMTVRGETYYPA